MNHLDEAMNKIMQQRTKVKEDFVRAYLAFNVKDITPEIFNTLVLVEEKVSPTITTFKVMTNDELEKGQR